MAMQKTTIGTVLAIALMGVVVTALGALVANRTISSTGNITAVGVGVYSDAACTTTLSTINWGTLSPGGTATQTIYVRNEGTVSVTLTMTTGSWNPASASSYIGLTWNRENYVLAAGSVVQASLTLTVSSSITGITSFSFTITITGTQ
jgi:hypothetical protein